VAKIPAIKLQHIMDRIINSEYSSIDQLIEISDTYSIEEIHDILEKIIVDWNLNKLKPVSMYALLKFFHKYLENSKLQIIYKNRKTIPICYFSSFLIMSALFLYSYLKTLSIDVELFPLHQTDKHLKQYLRKENPLLLIFTLTQFVHLNALKKLLPYLHKKNFEVYVGGIPFLYDDTLKNEFPNCKFPSDMKALSLSITKLLKEEKL
jgi:hypothetical protein